MDKETQGSSEISGSKWKTTTLSEVSGQVKSGQGQVKPVMNVKQVKSCQIRSVQSMSVESCQVSQIQSVKSNQDQLSQVKAIPWKTWVPQLKRYKVKEKGHKTFTKAGAYKRQLKSLTQGTELTQLIIYIITH